MVIRDPERIRNVKNWNQWRQDNSGQQISLVDVDLSGARLAGVNLSHATLSRVVLTHADLKIANFSHAHLKSVKLDGANLSRANFANARMSDCDLTESRMFQATLLRATAFSTQMYGVNLDGADLREAELPRSNLQNATLKRADLCEAMLYLVNLTGAHLENADLGNADLRGVSLIRANLSGANLNGAKLWETQRAGWNINGITCAVAGWSEDGREGTRYSPGEFESLFSYQQLIELFYKGGVSSFELSTLPALLQHLASLHPTESFRLKSIEETGGGAKLTIVVQGADEETLNRITPDAQELQKLQVQLREQQYESERLRIEKGLLLSEVFPRMLAAVSHSTHNTFNAPVTTAVVGDHSQVNVSTDPKITELLTQLISRSAVLNLTPSEGANLEVELGAVKDELHKPEPDKTKVQQSVEFIQRMAEEAAKKVVGKIAENGVSNYHDLLHELTQRLHHLL